MSVIVFTPNTKGVNCVTSVQFAKMFDIRHNNLLPKLKDLADDSGDTLNFQLISYKDSNNRTRPMWLLTETGFAIAVTSLNLKTGEHKILRRKILTQFNSDRERDLTELRKLKSQKELSSGKITKNEYGSKLERPKVMKANKSILVTPEIAEELEIEAGMVNANELSFGDILRCMIAWDESRVVGIEKAIGNKKRCLKEGEEFIAAGYVVQQEFDPADFKVKSEYNDILIEKIKEESFDSAVEIAEDLIDDDEE